MYVGSTGPDGLAHVLWELVANALDQHLAGHATRLLVSLNEDRSVTVEDDGLGFPIHDVGGIPFAQLALTEMHSTPTLDGHSPHAHARAMGVGACVANILSSTLVLDVFREGRHYRQRYELALPMTPIADQGPTDRRGTRITFAPDRDVFGDAEFDFDALVRSLRDLAILNPGLTIDVRDERRRRITIRHDDGLLAFLSDIPDAFAFSGESGGVLVDAAFRWNAWSSPNQVRTFANNAPTDGYGTHHAGLLRGIADAVLPDVAKHRRHARAVRNVLTYGLQAIVHVRLADPTFAGPTRDELASPSALLAVEHVVGEGLRAQFEERPGRLASLRAEIAEAVPALLLARRDRRSQEAPAQPRISRRTSGRGRRA